MIYIEHRYIGIYIHQEINFFMHNIALTFNFREKYNTFHFLVYIFKYIKKKLSLVLKL